MNLEFLNAIVTYGGVILGCVIGVLGGLIGTWCSIRNTKTPAERAFMIRCSLAVWVLVTAFLAGLILVPQPYNYLLWIPYPIILTAGILWMNRMQARLRGTTCG